MATETEFEPASASGIEATDVDPRATIGVLMALLADTTDRAASAAIQLGINTIRLQQAQIERMTHGGR